MRLNNDGALKFGMQIQPPSQFQHKTVHCPTNIQHTTCPDMAGEGVWSSIGSVLAKGKKAAQVAKKAGELGLKAYESGVGKAIINRLPSTDENATKGFAGEKHQILRLKNGFGVANFSGPGTALEKRLRRGDLKKTRSEVDRIAALHDIHFALAQGSKTRDEQVRKVRAADKRMLKNLARASKKKLDHPLNIKAAQAGITGKLAAEMAGVIPAGSYSGPLRENIPPEELGLYQQSAKQLEMEGYGCGHNIRQQIMQQLKQRKKKGKKGKGLKLAGQRGKGLKLAGQGKRRRKQKGGFFFNMEGLAQDVHRPNNPQSLVGKAVFGLANHMEQKRRRKKQKGGFVFAFPAIFAAIAGSTAATTAATAAATGAISTAAGIGVKKLIEGDGKKLSGGQIDSITNKLKNEIKKNQGKLQSVIKSTVVKQSQVPKAVIKKAKEALNKIQSTVSNKQELKKKVMQHVVKPLVPVIREKLHELVKKKMAGQGLSLAGGGLRLAGGSLTKLAKRILRTVAGSLKSSLNL